MLINLLRLLPPEQAHQLTIAAGLARGAFLFPAIAFGHGIGGLRALFFDQTTLLFGVFRGVRFNISEGNT